MCPIHPTSSRSWAQSRGALRHRFFPAFSPRFLHVHSSKITLSKIDAEGPTGAAAQTPEDHGEPEYEAPPSVLPVVPWGLKTTISVMVMWLVGFVIAAYSIVPAVFDTFLFEALSSGRMAAARHLLLDVLQLLFTFFLLNRTLHEYKPRSLGLFPFRFRPISSWCFPVGFGALSFPLIEVIHRRLIDVFERQAMTTLKTSIENTPNVYPMNTPTNNNQGIVHGMVESVALQGDWASCATWFAILALCAPIWEELIFRGFLLPSLAKTLRSPWLAVVCTSFLFALVHFSMEGFLPLVLLGMVFGSVYVKTHNLLPAMFLHSLWNVLLLWQLLYP